MLATASVVKLWKPPRYLAPVKEPMVDKLTPEKRSAVMAKIRGRNNQATDVRLARLLRQSHISGWRRHVRLTAGRREVRSEGNLRELGLDQAPTTRPRVTRPDFVFAGKRLAVFVDGCFWHSCPKHSNMPQSNRMFWERKLTANKRRDMEITKSLRSAGWAVVRIWEHDLVKRPEWCIRRIGRALDLDP